MGKIISGTFNSPTSATTVQETHNEDLPLIGLFVFGIPRQEASDGAIDGMAYSRGMAHGTGSTEQFCDACNSIDNVTPADCAKTRSDGNIIACFNSTHTSIDTKANLSASDNNSFTIDFTLIESGQHSKPWGYIAILSDKTEAEPWDFKVVQWDPTNGVGDETVTGAGFAPDSAQTWAHANITSNEQIATNWNKSWGFTDRFHNSFSQTFHGQDNQAASNTGMRWSNGIHLFSIGSTGGIIYQARIKSFDSDGMTLDKEVANMSANALFLTAFFKNVPWEMRWDDIYDGNGDDIVDDIVSLAVNPEVIFAMIGREVAREPDSPTTIASITEAYGFYDGTNYFSNNFREGDAQNPSNSIMEISDADILKFRWSATGTVSRRIRIENILSDKFTVRQIRDANMDIIESAKSTVGMLFVVYGNEFNTSGLSETVQVVTGTMSIPTNTVDIDRILLPDNLVAKCIIMYGTYNTPGATQTTLDHNNLGIGITTAPYSDKRISLALSDRHAVSTTDSGTILGAHSFMFLDDANVTTIDLDLDVIEIGIGYFDTKADTTIGASSVDEINFIAICAEDNLVEADIKQWAWINNTSDQDITGYEFAGGANPDGPLINIGASGLTAYDSSQSDAVYSNGLYDGTDQGCVSGISSDNEGVASNCSSSYHDARFIYERDASGTTTQAEATLDSILTKGFRLTKQTSAQVGQYATCALRGLIGELETDDVPDTPSSDIERTYTTTKAVPNGILALGGGANYTGTPGQSASSNGLVWTMGAVGTYGRQACCIGQSVDDYNIDEQRADTRHQQQMDRFLIYSDGTSGTLTGQAKVFDVKSDGYKVNWRNLGDPTNNGRQFHLVLGRDNPGNRGLEVVPKKINTKAGSGAGSQVFAMDAGKKPFLVMMMTTWSGSIEADVDIAWSMGMGTSSKIFLDEETSTIAWGYSDDAALSPTDSRQFFDRDAILSHDADGSEVSTAILEHFTKDNLYVQWESLDAGDTSEEIFILYFTDNSGLNHAGIYYPSGNNTANVTEDWQRFWKPDFFFNVALNEVLTTSAYPRGSTGDMVPNLSVIRQTGIDSSFDETWEGALASSCTADGVFTNTNTAVWSSDSLNTHYILDAPGSVDHDVDWVGINYNSASVNFDMEYEFDAISSWGAGGISLMIAITNFSQVTALIREHIQSDVSTDEDHVNSGLDFDPTAALLWFSNAGVPSLDSEVAGMDFVFAYEDENLQFNREIVFPDNVASVDQCHKVHSSLIPYSDLDTGTNESTDVHATLAITFGTAELTTNVIRDSTAFAVVEDKRVHMLAFDSQGANVINLFGTASMNFSTSSPQIITLKSMASAPSITFSSTSDLTIIDTLLGSTLMQFSSVAPLTGIFALKGVSSLQFSQTASLLNVGPLSASTTMTFSSTARLSGIFTLSGSTAMEFFSSGRIRLGAFGFSLTLSDDVLSTSNDDTQVLLEISSDAIPSNPFPDDQQIDRGILALPTVEKTVDNSLFGISGFNQVSMILNNIDKRFNGIELLGTFARLWLKTTAAFEEIKGIISQYRLGAEVRIQIRELELEALETDLPKRTITTEDFPKATDVGERVPIIFGRATRVKCLYVHFDDALREYDFIIGEGTGLNGNFFSQVFTAYRNDSALDDIEGDVVSAGSNTLVIELADQRPDAWYNYFWIEITAGTGVGQFRHITDYVNSTNELTVDSNWTTVPDATSDYRLTEWRFFDGSNAIYPDYAFLRFKKRLGRGDRFDDIHVDCDGLQDETNFVRAIQSLLTNTTWGLGLTVDTTNFNTEAALTDVTDLMSEGAITRRERAYDIIQKLLAFRDARLTKDDDIKITVDVSKTEGDTFGFNDDGGSNNIVDGKTVEINYGTLEETAKEVIVHYRNHYKRDEFQHKLTKKSNPVGIDKEIDLPFVYEHETADRIADYKSKRAISQFEQITFTAGFDGRPIGKGELIRITIPHLGVNSTYEVIGVVRIIGRNYKITTIRYMNETYVYAPTFPLPKDESPDIPKDFANSAPDPVSGVVITPGTGIDEGTGQINFFFEVTWTPPEDNFVDALAEYRIQGDTLFSEGSRGETGAKVYVPAGGTFYDIQITAFGINPEYPSYPIVSTGNLADTDTRVPATPSTPSISVHRQTATASITIDPEEFVDYFEFVFTNSGGTTLAKGVKSVKAQRNVGTIEHTESWTNSSSSTQTVRCKVRGVSFSNVLGVYSTLSSTVNTAQNTLSDMGPLSIDTGNLFDGTVDEAKRIAVLTVSGSHNENSLIPGASRTAELSHGIVHAREPIPNIKASTLPSGDTAFHSVYPRITSSSLIIYRYHTLNNTGGTVNHSINYTISYW